MKKRGLIKIIIITLIIISLLILIYSFTIKEEPVSKTTSPRTYTPTTTYNQVQQPVQHLTLKDIQNLLDRTTVEFPDNTLLNIRVYDEAHNPIGLDFSIKGKLVYPGLNENSDGEFWIGTWYEEKARQSSDLCSLISQMKADQNIKFESKISKISLLIKYKNLRSCFGL